MASRKFVAHSDAALHCKENWCLSWRISGDKKARPAPNTTPLDNGAWIIVVGTVTPSESFWTAELPFRVVFPIDAQLKVHRAIQEAHSRLRERLNVRKTRDMILCSPQTNENWSLNKFEILSMHVLRSHSSRQLSPFGSSKCHIGRLARVYAVVFSTTPFLLILDTPHATPKMDRSNTYLYIYIDR